LKHYELLFEYSADSLITLERYIACVHISSVTSSGDTSSSEFRYYCNHISPIEGFPVQIVVVVVEESNVHFELMDRCPTKLEIVPEGLRPLRQTTTTNVVICAPLSNAADNT
ncbi:12101_t:CDS:2, partial [Gigaspora margarita]